MPQPFRNNYQRTDKEEVCRPSKKAKLLDHKLSSNEGATSASASATGSDNLSAAYSQDTKDTSAGGRSRRTSSTLRHVEITDPDLSLRDKLTSEKGQLEENPYYSREQAREAAKREYNRRNAARARIRRKCMLSELQEKCMSMESEMQSLKTENAALKAEIQEMKQRTCSQGLDGSNSTSGSSNVLQREHVLRLPQLQMHGSVGTDALLQQGQLLAQMSMMNGFRQPNPIVMGGVPLVPVIPSQREDSMVRQSMHSLMLDRARADLNSTGGPSRLADMFLQDMLTRNVSNFLPK